MTPDTIVCDDALEVMAAMPDNSVDLLLTDPPYYRVKGEWWDRQWDTAQGFIDWIGQLCEQWQRILKPNGSLYVFASPRMAARVECKVGERFNVVQRITWRKPPFSTKAEMFNKPDLRMFFPASEAIIFAEHYGADNIAKGEAGYEAKCDELRGFIFEPLRAYLDGERRRAGIDNSIINAAWCEWKHVASTSQTQKWFSSSCFNPPTREAYEWLRGLFHRLNHGGEYLRREYEYLRREYEDLRREYEDLRRPFTVSADVPYTDVWDFPTVSAYPGKHPCEKPLPLLEHIIRASSRPGALVCDPFIGSGATADAALRNGRHWYGCDIEPRYVAQAQGRIERARMAQTQTEMAL